MSTAVGIVGGLGETVEIDTSHQSIMPEQRPDDAAEGRGSGMIEPRIFRELAEATGGGGSGQRRPADGSAPGRRGAIGAADTTTPTQATRNKMMKPP